MTLCELNTWNRQRARWLSTCLQEFRLFFIGAYRYQASITRIRRFGLWAFDHSELPMARARYPSYLFMATGSWVGQDYKVIDVVGDIGRHGFVTSIINVNTSLVNSLSTYSRLKLAMT